MNTKNGKVCVFLSLLKTKIIVRGSDLYSGFCTIPGKNYIQQRASLQPPKKRKLNLELAQLCLDNRAHMVWRLHMCMQGASAV